MTSTMAWAPLLLTLLAHCTGDWMTVTWGAADTSWAQGFGPGRRSVSCGQQGALWDRPVAPTQLLTEDFPLTGAWAWGLGPVRPDGDQLCLCWQRPLSHSLCVVSAGASSQGPPRGEPTSMPLSLGCELSSSPRAQGGAGQSLEGPPFAWQPLLWQRVGRKGGLGSPAPLWAQGCEHHGLDSSAPRAPLSLHR